MIKHLIVKILRDDLPFNGLTTTAMRTIEANDFFLLRVLSHTKMIDIEA